LDYGLLFLNDNGQNQSLFTSKTLRCGLKKIGLIWKKTSLVQFQSSQAGACPLKVLFSFKQILKVCCCRQISEKRENDDSLALKY